MSLTEKSFDDPSSSVGPVPDSSSDLTKQLLLWNDRAEKIKSESECLENERRCLQELKESISSCHRQAEEQTHQCRKLRAILADLRSRNQQEAERRSTQHAEVLALRSSLEHEARVTEDACRAIEDQECRNQQQFERSLSTLVEQESTLETQLRHQETELYTKKELLRTLRQERSAALHTQRQLKDLTECIHAERQRVQELRERRAALERERIHLDEELSMQESKRELMARQNATISTELSQNEQYLQQLHALSNLVQSAHDGMEEVQDMKWNLDAVQDILCRGYLAPEGLVIDGRKKNRDLQGDTSHPIKKRSKTVSNLGLATEDSLVPMPP